MKKLSLSLLVVAIGAAASAFTTQTASPGEFVNTSSGIQPKDQAIASGLGNCEDAPDVCTYIKNSSGQLVPENPQEHKQWVDAQ